VLQGGYFFLNVSFGALHFGQAAGRQRPSTSVLHLPQTQVGIGFLLGAQDHAWK